MAHDGAELAKVEPAYAGWCKVFVATIRLPDGRSFTREIEHHGRATAVLPFDPVRRTAIVIRQLRAPALYVGRGEHLIEAIAGLVENGEDIAASAQRECLEEAGLRLATIEHIATTWTMPGISTERMDLFLGSYAAADRVSAGGGLPDEHEEIEVIELPLRDLVAMIEAGEEIDMKVLTLVQTLRLRRPELFA
jgi:nudix-type nucleoside diphosphatase (YffH/AdpP family)